jgi:two-component system, NtrC family, sensor kinase
MKRILISIVILSYVSIGLAQNRAIDSLKTLIRNEKTDTTRINLTNDLVNRIGQINLDSALFLGNKVVLEARKIGYKKGETDALVTISSNLMMKGDFVAAAKTLDQAKALVSTFRDSTSIAAVYGTYGMMYGMQSKYDSAAVYLQKAIGIAERTGNKEDLAGYYGNLAIGYMQQSNYPQALLYQQKSLQLAEERKDISSQAYTILNMGLTYQDMGDPSRSEKSLLNAIDLAEQAGLKKVEIYSYSNLASVYTDLEKWEDSYSYAMKAVDLAIEMGDIPIAAASYSKAAIALANLKQYDQAKALIEKGMANAQASGQPIIINQLNNAMAHTLVLQGRYSEAIPFYEKCLEVSKNTDEYNFNTTLIYSQLALCYEKTGAYEKALSNFKKYATIKDSISLRENIQKATELNMNFEFERKQALARAEQDIKDAQAERIRNQQYFAIILLGIVLLALGFVAFQQYRSKRNKQRANLLLQREKHKVEATLTELKSTQAQLIQSEKMATLGELTAGIAHEIQNPLNFVNNFSEVNRELILELKEEKSKDKKERDKKLEAELLTDIDQNLEKIIHHGKRADSIVKGMLQHSRHSNEVKEPTDINALCDEYLRLAYHGLRARDKTFNAQIKTDFDKSIGKINVVPQDIGRVVLNLITNAFYAVNERSSYGKSSEENYEPTVELCTRNIKDVVEIHVADNGNGIPVSIREKIFQPFFTTKPAGQGTGLGLSLSYDIVRAHGGELKVVVGDKVGSLFIIRLPNK